MRYAIIASCTGAVYVYCDNPIHFADCAFGLGGCLKLFCWKVCCYCALGCLEWLPGPMQCPKA